MNEMIEVHHFSNVVSSYGFLQVVFQIYITIGKKRQLQFTLYADFKSIIYFLFVVFYYNFKKVCK